MLGYLFALLASVAVTFTTLSDGVQEIYRGGPWVGGVVGVLGGAVIAISRPRRLGPGFWPLAGLAAGRIVSAAWHGSGWEFALVALVGPLSYLAFTARRDGIQGALQRFGLALVGVQLLMLGVGYIISLNLMGHLLLICLASYLPEIRPGGRWIQALAVLAALLSTTSKGSVAALVVMAAVYGGRLWLAIPAAPVAALAMWAFRPWRSLQWRLRCWSEAWRKFGQSAMIGQGPGTLAWDHSMAQHAHNGILNELMWDGTIGLMLVALGLAEVIHQRARWPRWAWAGMAGAAAHYLVDDFSGCALCLAMAAALLAANHKSEIINQ